ncbi:NADH-quinone oxidoreductase subunit NuoH [Desulfatirhabdium butyrativorans]|uniref:NADH-quinone oxidoreductase subunit NuoH n=1 Tax=Desulfatirhabdium butyrativorans TaxID=340467 RepID=UPI00040AD574|nr:NADH-quinone oxidoreductase subunit NuoH [Desulfatirhabdium butyrativorans]
MIPMLLDLLAHPVVRIVVALALTMAFVGLMGLVLVYAERKVAGYIQRRPGPFEVGPQGILQSLADAGKLVGKQLVRPFDADPVLFWVAPVLSLAPVVVCFLPMPFGPILTGMQINVGIVLVLAFSGLNTLALCLAGWGSSNKYSLLGSARAVSQSVAYEIPLLLAVLAVAFQAGSLDLSEITIGQSKSILSWNIWTQPLAALIFFVSLVAETNRAPFDLPEAESELTAGFHTEYSGMGFGLFFLAEYTYMIIGCAMTSCLFLGGWSGPIADGHWWFLAKTFALLLVMMWFRWTFPRVRFDQLLNICWKWLIPLGLVNLVLTALVIKVVG